MWAGIAARAVGWLLVAALAAVMLTAVVVPRVAGGQTYTVLSGSMTPTYPVGSLIVVRPVDPKTIVIGQAITYQLRSGEPAVVTHRVIGIRLLDGQRAFITQGDANGAPDAEPVRAVQIRGVVWYAVPWLGYANQAFGGQVRAVLLPIAVLALVGYAGVQLAQHARDKRRRPPSLGAEDAS